MAEGYLKSMCLKDVFVSSRGLYAGGDAVSEHSATVMREIGVDISGHISKQLTKTDLNADMLVCMTPSHKQVLQGAGVDKKKIYVLGGGIPDPFMKGENAYRVCRDSITAAIDGMVFGGMILPYKVSAASEYDIKDIAELEKRCFSLPWSENAIKDSMNASTLFYIAKEQDKTVGYIGLSVAADEAYITNVAVFEEYRKKGVGTLLLDCATVSAREKGCAFISLEVRASNIGAIGLYEKLNFKREGIRKGFYSDPREDAIIMTRRFFDVDTGD